MKILQISQGYNAPFLGVSQHYASILAHHGQVTTIYLTGDESKEIEEVTGGSEVIFWQLKSKQLKGIKIKSIYKLYKLFKNEQFDLVVCHRYKAIYLAGLIQLFGLKFKQIGVIHAFGVFNNWTRKKFINLLASRLTLLGVSNAVCDDISAAMPDLPMSRVHTLYNAVDIEVVESNLLNRISARNFLGLPEDKFIIGNVGRLHPDKDQETLIKAFAIFNKNVPNSQLAILGSGRLKEKLIQLACEFGVEKQILFLGQVKHAAKYYKAFDLFALASDKEAFGLVLLEAMIAKVPVVACDCGGAKEVVSGAGWMFDFGCFEALADIMLRVHSGEKDELVDFAFQQLEEKYSLNATNQKLTAIIET